MGCPSGGGAGGLPATASAVVATIPLSNYGTDVAVRPDGMRTYVPLQTGSVLALDLYQYVTCYGASEVSVIDTRTNAVVATVGVANDPRAIADGKLAYVRHSSPISSVIDLQHVAGIPGR